MGPAAFVEGVRGKALQCDGKSVYVVFGTGIVACYDLEGNRTWARLVERPSHGWGHSSSPVLVGDTLIVHVQKVWGLKASDGQTAWPADSAQAWGTPAGARVGGTAVVITPAGDLIRADNGGKIASKLGGLTYASPLVHDGLVYFLQDKACCVRLPEKAEPVAQLTAVWANAGRQKRYYASSVLHEGRLYMVNQAGDFNVLDAASGATLSGRKLDLGGTTYPSIALAGGHIFVSSDSGVTIVLTPGNDAPQVARNTLEPFRSTPVFEGARMYVRAMENLYCIGK
ncbi:MAG: PQQ-binding-like beta-propeller repeat protein [Planctomycetota bacterium]|nr:PQQ-binding-like beta-propeller repeat protein [Planctomycetota bacterium]